jgi:hypothetical protein
VAYVEDAVVEAECEGIPEVHWPEADKVALLDVTVDRAKLCGSCFTVHGAGQEECS